MLQIASGLIKGLQIQSPVGDQTRPSGQRLRQAIFNVLRNYRKSPNENQDSILEGASVADIFAGTGALGFEAASNGASHLYFIENHRQTIKPLAANIEKVSQAFKKQGFEIEFDLLTGSVDQEYRRLPHDLDIVFADPPYRLGWDTKLAELEQKYQRLRPGGLLIFESAIEEVVWGEDSAKKAGLRLFDRKIYGDSAVYYLIKVTE